MKPYIYGKRNLIHIVDLCQTIRGLVIASKFAAKLARDGREVIFVGTKRQARSIIQSEAERCGMHFVTERWLGGMLTNFRTVRQRLKRLTELETMEQTGEIQEYSKKMISSLNRERRKILRNLDGVRNMTEPPGALVVIDPHKEHIAVKEARKLGIPTICLTDTNCDPDMVDIIVPGNDDAIKAIRILCKVVGDAIEKGKKERAARLGPVTPLAPQAPAEAAPAAQEPGPAQTQPAAQTPAQDAAQPPAAQSEDTEPKADTPAQGETSPEPAAQPDPQTPTAESPEAPPTHAAPEDRDSV